MFEAGSRCLGWGRVGILGLPSRRGRGWGRGGPPSRTGELVSVRWEGAEELLGCGILLFSRWGGRDDHLRGGESKVLAICVCSQQIRGQAL